MPISNLTRRAFVTTLTALGLSADDEGWVNLFDGHTLGGWRPSDSHNSWKVVDGELTSTGPPSQLFYVDAVGRTHYSFELEIEALANSAATSAVFFPEAIDGPTGLAIRINNTADNRAKTGSLLGLRHIYKQFVPDNQWFKLRITVRGVNTQVRINGMLVVDYTGNSVAPNRGLALRQEGVAPVRFRSIRVRPLPDNTPGPARQADQVNQQIISQCRRGIPMEDLHVHLKMGLTLELAIAKSLRDGIQYGIAVNCGQANTAQNDEQALQFIDSLKGQPCFIAMQAEGREWTRMFSRAAAARFDYIFTDSMTWTDNHGKRMRLWMPDEVGTITDPQEFMETFVDRTVGILEHEPIDVYANPTYLPDQIARDYERLWTEPRRRRVIEAAVRNQVAIEINNRRNLPSPSFLHMAKAAGAKFTFGTNNAGLDDLGRCEYGLRMVEECGLVAEDFFVPLSGPKAIERKGFA